jgi:hypothetical protein
MLVGEELKAQSMSVFLAANKAGFIRRERFHENKPPPFPGNTNIVIRRASRRAFGWMGYRRFDIRENR